MGHPPIPNDYVLYVFRMNKETNIPFDAIAWQAQIESGFNKNAVSPAGAEGWLQFLPSTFRAYGTGSPFNINDEAHAWTNFMFALGRQFSWRLQRMLGAYNAGPGNWQAGLGYANEILDNAGVSRSYVVSPPGASGGTTQTASSTSSGQGAPAPKPPGGQGTPPPAPGGGQPAPAPSGGGGLFDVGAAPPVDPDDWSWWVGQTASWLADQAALASQYASILEGL